MKNIINIAIIAHVDAGKSTLVDGILSSSGVLRENHKQIDRIMDSNDLEKERGITIYSKNCSINYKDTKINIVDTPGHADFSGEVERIIKTVDTVILLVDSAEGVMPQTRFVLRKALEQDLNPIVLINKMDKEEKRVDEVLEEIYDLFIDLNANDRQIDFPILYGITRDFKISNHRDMTNPSMDVLFETILSYSEVYPDFSSQDLQMQITTLGYDQYIGRLGIGRISKGRIQSESMITMINNEGEESSHRLKKLFVYNGISYEEVEEAFCGDIVVVAGIDTITVGDTICTHNTVNPMSPILIEEPTLSMNFYVNTSPFLGLEGKYITSRNIKERLDLELEVNVGLTVEEGQTSDTFIVSGRGELHLSTLIETMRREGYELAIGKPNVIFKEINGELFEPIEKVIIESPEEYSGKIIDELSTRKGTLYDMKTEGSTIIQSWYIPSRFILGFRTQLINLSRGTAVMLRSFEKYEKKVSNIRTEKQGSLVSNSLGDSMAFPMFHLQVRGDFFIGAQTKVYPGMIVGRANQDNDLWINVIRNKRLNSFRGNGTGGKEEQLKLDDPIPLTLEYALDYISDDELVEVTPQSIRLRKKNLKQ